MTTRTAFLRGASACVLLLGLATSPAVAADLRGAVVDTNGAALPGARIILGDRGVAAGPDGRFSLTGLPPGERDVVVDYVGYAQSRQAVTLTDAAPAAVTLVLGADDAVSALVVTGQRAADRRALQSKKVAENLVETLYANDVGKLPDQNVAEAVRRLPGVSVANDQGEGRYVIIRGVDPKYANVTVNGQTAAAPEPDNRQVKLDDIPASLISSVSVIKSLTADLDANAIAGQVDINTLSAFDRKAAFANARAAYGEYDLNNKHPYEGDVTVGGTFGQSRQFGAVLSANYSKRPIESQNVAGASWSTVGGFAVPGDFDVRDYNLERERTGFVGNFDWRPTDGVKAYLRTTYSKFTDHENRDRFRFPVSSTITNQTATTGAFSKAAGTRYVRKRDEDDNTKTASTGFQVELPVGRLNVDAVYSKARKDDPLRSEFTFVTAKTLTGTYDTSDMLFRVTPSAAAFDPANYSFSAVNYDIRHAAETLKQLRADYRLPISAFGGDSYVKVGAKVLDRSKTNDREITYYTPGATAFTLAALNPSSLASTYEGRYPFGPQVNYAAAQAYVTANAATLKLDAAKSLSTSLLSDYDVSETISAGYAMASLAIGRLTLTPGLRVEHTEGDYTSKSYNAASKARGADLTASNSYTNWFPGLNAKIDASERLVLRFAATTAIGRPDYTQLAQGVSVDTSANMVSLGNADLKPLTATNLDAAVEYYLPGQGLLSVATFFKDIQDPIFTQTLANQSGTYAGIALTNAFVTTPLNARKAHIAGIEFNAQSQLTMLPTPLDGLGFSANLTLVDSAIRGVPGRSESLPLTSQSKRVATAQLFYEKASFAARVAYSYRSAYLATIGADRGSDVYWGDHGQVDARVSYAIDKATLFFEANNIGDTPWRTYVGTKHQLGENERYGPSIRTGMQLAF